MMVSMDIWDKICYTQPTLYSCKAARVQTAVELFLTGSSSPFTTYFASYSWDMSGGRAYNFLFVDMKAEVDILLKT